MTATTALKLHLRVLEVCRRTLRVVTLRPQTGVRFSTNYFHDTWHILGGSDGMALLGRLLWGLAFQRHAGTLILIDDPHLVPTPFEADPADPIALVPDGLTQLDDDVLRALRLRLRRAPGPPTTIRWHTFGMPAALARDDDDEDRERRWLRAQRWGPQGRPPAIWTRERMSRRAGFVCYTAPAPVLRAHGLGIYRMHAGGAGYYPIAEHGARRAWGSDGEVQPIPRFAARVAAACIARRELLPDERGLLAERDERTRVYRRADEVLARIARARRG